MSNLTLVSTTDAPEAVSAALGIEHVADNSVAESEETQAESAAASEAGEETQEHEQPEETDGSEGDKKPEEKPAKKGGFQKRIDKLTRELAETRRQLEANASAKPAAAEAKPAEQAPAQAADDFAKPKPKLEDFPSLEDYTEAVSDWKLDQREHSKAQAAAKERAEKEAKELTESWQTRKADAQARHEDFDEVLEAVSDVKIPPALQRAILESEHGPEIAYTLAQDRKELARIAALSPLAAAREVGKLEAQLIAESAPKPKTKTSAAPAPIKPVGSTKSTATSKDPGEMSYREYRAWRDRAA